VRFLLAREYRNYSSRHHRRHQNESPQTHPKQAQQRYDGVDSWKSTELPTKMRSSYDHHHRSCAKTTKVKQVMCTLNSHVNTIYEAKTAGNLEFPYHEFEDEVCRSLTLWNETSARILHPTQPWMIV